MELFKQSAAQGNKKALVNIGFCHEHGLGITQSYQEARRFYTLASAEGVENLNQLEERIRAECPFLGKQVVITGTSREDLNGRTGTAASFDHARRRYVVELDGEIEKLKLKPENLAPHAGPRGNKKKTKPKTKTKRGNI